MADVEIQVVVEQEANFGNVIGSFVCGCLIAGQRETDRPVLSQGPLWGNSGNALRHDGFKLIEDSDSGIIQFFDINSDPDEKNDLSNSNQERASIMRNELHLILDKLQTTGNADEALSLDDEQRQQLRALGYLD